MTSHAFALPFEKRVEIVENVYEFYFSREYVPFDFLAGQYIRLFLPHQNPDKKGTTRFFTISSPPFEKEYLKITTKLGDSTLKKNLLSRKKGDEVQFYGPLGQFVIPRRLEKPLVFLSGGLGLTPFYSMIAQAAHDHSLPPITLLASFSTPKDVIYCEELTRIMKENPLLNIVYTVTHPDAIWKGETERLSLSLLKKYAPDFKKSHLYITGPTDLVTQMQQVLMDDGFSEEQLQPEIFTGY